MKQKVQKKTLQRAHGQIRPDTSHAAESKDTETGSKEVKETQQKGWRSVGITPHEGRKEHNGRRAAIMNHTQEMKDGEDEDKQGIAETTEAVKWHLTGKDITFSGAYDTIALRGKSPW